MQAMLDEQADLLAAMQASMADGSILPMVQASMGTNYSFGGVGYSFSAGASGTASGARRKAVTRLRVTDLAVIAELNPFHKSPIALVGGSPGDQD